MCIYRSIFRSGMHEVKLNEYNDAFKVNYEKTFKRDIEKSLSGMLEKVKLSVFIHLT